jgi:hypothetical protein
VPPPAVLTVRLNAMTRTGTARVARGRATVRGRVVVRR